MIIGYARVSTMDQSLDIQIDAIEKYAAEEDQVDRIFIETQSGGKIDREGLQLAMDSLRKGDTFVVYRLDRLARSTKQLYELTDQIRERGAEFVSLRDSIDTNTAAGRAMFGMLAVFAEFERAIIQERTQAGLQSARKRGRVGGRPSLDDRTKQQIVKLFNSGERAKDIAEEYKIGKSTVYKVLNEFEKKK